MTTVTGFFGKLPAHGDFVRRALPAAVVASLDDWLQDELGRDGDPDAAIAGFDPVRFASTAVADGQLGLGTIAGSSDRVGRAYVVTALRLSPYPAGAVPAAIPPAWDDWCGRAEAVLVAARDAHWTADATQAAIESAGRASVVELVADPPALVADIVVPTTLWWRPRLDGTAATGRCESLPRDAAFDDFIGRTAENR